MFTIKQAAALSGCLEQTLRNYITAGVVAPAEQGTTGTGKGHRLSLMQVFALAVAKRFRNAGADPERTICMARYLSRLTEEKLEAFFADGRTYPMTDDLMQQAAMEEGLTLHAGVLGTMEQAPAIDPKENPALARKVKQLFGNGGPLHLPTILADVQAQAAKLASKPEAKRRSRKRGLATK